MPRRRGRWQRRRCGGPGRRRCCDATGRRRCCDAAGGRRCCDAAGRRWWRCGGWSPGPGAVASHGGPRHRLGVFALLHDAFGLVLLGCGQRGQRGVGEFAGGAVALVRIFRHPAGDHLVERRRNLSRADLAGARGGLHQVCRDQLFDAVGPKRRGPGQTFAQHAGKRIDVGPIGDFIAGEPLGCHVLVGPHRHPGLGQPLVGAGAGNTEIHQVCEVVSGDQNVLRFHITVRHTAGMCGVQRRGDLSHDGHCPRWAHWPVAFQHAGQVGAVDQAHVQVKLAVDLAVVVDRHDVWLGQPSCGVGLALHPGAKRRVVGVLRRYQLEGYGPALAAVFGLVDLAHSAAAQQPHQPVGPEP